MLKKLFVLTIIAYFVIAYIIPGIAILASFFSTPNVSLFAEVLGF